MCLILFSHEQHPSYHLVLAANRDELYDRPTDPAHFWEAGDGILAGRDRQAGGTWMGITRTGRWAAVTNFRDVSTPRKEDAPSRGSLVREFLQSSASPAAYLDDLAARADRYNGFNLLVGELGGVGYLSNRNGPPQSLSPGLYGISNHFLDTPWPKVKGGTTALADILERDRVEPERLLDLLADTTVPPDEQLPDTGIGLEQERVVAPRLIRGERYGTRSSTVLLVRRTGDVTFVERSFVGDGESFNDRRFDFELRQ